MRFSVHQLSRRGGRKRNEDRVAYAYTRKAVLLVVADGMGGHPQGDLAAQTAVEALIQHFQRLAVPALPDPSGFLSLALMSAHARVQGLSPSAGVGDAPRTTLVAAVLQDGQAVWAHCGDSRLYWIRGPDVMARTLDHTYAERARVGQISHGHAVNRNVLFSCLGAPGRPMVDVSEPVVLAPEDHLLLCSDGLWTAVEEPQLVAHLMDQAMPAAVPALVRLALERSGARSDNVTALALRWEGAGAVDMAPPDDSAQADWSEFPQTQQWPGTGLMATQPVAVDSAELEQAAAEIRAMIVSRQAKRS